MLRLERLALVAVGQQDVVVVEDRRAAGSWCSPARSGTRTGSPRAGPGPAPGSPGSARPPRSCPASTSASRSGCPRDRLAGQRLELVPGERERAVDLAVDPEVPRGQVGRGDAAVVEDGELLGQVLAGRDARGGRRILGLAPKRRSNMFAPWAGPATAPVRSYPTGRGRSGPPRFRERDRTAAG